jgi:hypothetical protein
LALVCIRFRFGNLKKEKEGCPVGAKTSRKGTCFIYQHNVKDFDPYFTYYNSGLAGLACLHSGFCSGNCQAHKQVENNFF